MSEIKQNMGDKEYMNDVLMSSKTLTSMYQTAVQESSTNDVHTSFKDVLNCSIDMQHTLFSVMEQKGWYPQQYAQKAQIEQVKQKFANG